jgi:hypothetical protein
VGEVGGVVGAGDGVDPDDGAGERRGEFGDELLGGVGVVTEADTEAAVDPGRMPGPMAELLSAPSRR